MFNINSTSGIESLFPRRKWSNYDEMVAYRNAALHIDNLKPDGFEKVCDVRDSGYCQWNYANMNDQLMFADHRSWVYAITQNNIVVKIGESGNPLGIKMPDGQPKVGTQ